MTTHQLVGWVDRDSSQLPQPRSPGASTHSADPSGLPLSHASPTALRPGSPAEAHPCAGGFCAFHLGRELLGCPALYLGFGPPCSHLPDSQCFKTAGPAGKQPPATLRLSQEDLAPPLIPPEV